ncbi:MAG: hypothetical protein R3178_02050, partial [Rhodothermales bacterium]|nr:hypothetical protein [Rhodothermales bacterium]
ARNGALAGFNVARQALASAFTDGSYAGKSDGADYRTDVEVSGDVAHIESVGSIIGAREIPSYYTIKADVRRRMDPGCVPFDIDKNYTIPQVDYNLRVEVIGTAITAGSYDVPVTTKLHLGDEEREDFGAFEDPSAGAVGGGDVFEPSTVYSAGTPISVSAQSWLKSGNTGWKKHIKQDSRQDDKHLLVLRDGDPVPTVAGYSGQTSAVEFLKDYIDSSGNVTLEPNQSIYLFELGTVNRNQAAYDLQDLVVLVTLWRGDTASGGTCPGSDWDLSLASYSEW